MSKVPLNEEQLLAVHHPVGEPAVLIAGAGSGKTKVLTERVRWLMDDQGVKPRRIVAITFTNKAAGELIHRLGITQNTPLEQLPRVSTIHSLALGGIRRDPRAFGLQDKVTPLDDYDQKQMMQKIIDRKKLPVEVNVWKVLEKISYHRARGIGFCAEYTDAVHGQALKAHGGYHALEEEDTDLWAEFETEKRKNSVVDFDDMVHLVVRRLRTDPEWKASLQRQFDHVLMDEAQDTNPVQWEFVNGLLGPGNANIYVVGDMSQSIYGFNGAAPQILKGFSEGWRGTQPRMYRIARNHRSVPEIVNFANLIQQKMTATIPLAMESWRGMNGDKGLVKKVVAGMPQDIAHAIAIEIQKDALKKRERIAYKDNAILVRAAIQIRDIEGELVRRRIPYVVRGGRGLLQTEEVRDVMAYLRLAANHKDFMAFVRACGAPRCGVGEAGLEKLRQQADESFEGDLIEAARKNAKLAPLCATIDHAGLLKDSPIAVFEKIMSMVNYKAYVQVKYKREAQKVKAKLENLDRFGIMVIALTQEDKRNLDDLIFQLTLDRPKGDDEEERDAVEQAFQEGKITEAERDAKVRAIEDGSVTISTIHSAKGLEWCRVFVPNLVEGSLPHRFSMGSEDEIEEERRLFYVACTRAKDILVLGVPERQQSEANTVRLKPSRFLAELGV